MPIARFLHLVSRAFLVSLLIATATSIGIGIAGVQGGPISASIAQEARALVAREDPSPESQRVFRRTRNVAIAAVLILAVAGIAFALRSERSRQTVRRRVAATWRSAQLLALANRVVAVGNRAAVLTGQLDASIATGKPWVAISAIALATAALTCLWYAWRISVLRGPLHLELPWRLALLAGGLGLACAMLVIGLIAGRAWQTPLSYRTHGAFSWTFAALACAVLATFPVLDVWNGEFDRPGPVYLAYNLARLLFMPVLAFALIGMGRWVLSLVSVLAQEPEIPAIDHAVACFFVGAAAWYLIVFPVGLLGLLLPAVVAPVFVLAVGCAGPVASAAAQGFRDWIYRATRLRTFSSTVAAGVATFALVGSLFHVLVNRGMAVIGFEYDASGHYLPYFDAVAKSGTTQVNELWYHFWVSKGAALHFVSVLLTDIQGPQLVSYTMLCAAVVTLGMLVYRISDSAVISLSAMACYAGTYTHSFPYFQKHHIVTAALVCGMLWFARESWMSRARCKTGLYAIALLGAAAVVNAPPLAAVLIPFVAVIGLLAVFPFGVPAKRRITAGSFPALAVAAVLATVLAINLALTGLMEVTPFRLFWSLADQARFSAFASPYLMLFAETGTAPSTGKIGLLGALDPIRIRNLLHAQYLPPGMLLFAFLALMAATVIATLMRQLRTPFVSVAGPASVLIACATGLSLLVRQPGSIDRFYIFALLPVTLLAFVPFGLLARAMKDAGGTSRQFSVVWSLLRTALFAGAAIVAVVACATWINGHFQHETRRLFTEKLRFLLGQSSFRETFSYNHQPRDMAIWPRQEVSPACLGVRDTLVGQASGKDDPPRVWTMTFLQEMGCHILPGTRFMLEFSNRFGAHWHRIVFGTPGEALAELKAIGVGHFFIELGERDEVARSNESTSIFGCLAYSPLMEPSTIGERFRVLWTNGSGYLLVTARNVGTPLPADFATRLERKRERVQPGLGDQRGICNRVRGYYLTQLERWPARGNPALPPVQGWQ